MKKKTLGLLAAVLSVAVLAGCGARIQEMALVQRPTPERKVPH